MATSSLLGIAILLHVIAAVIWVGGMFFAHQCLRPIAASQLEPPARQTLWVGVFGRFFPWVWVAIGVILTTGFWMLFAVFGGFGGAGAYIHAMLVLGLAMTAIFLHVFFAPYRRLKRAVAAQDWPTGGRNLTLIRHLIGINTVLGLITIATAVGGRYLAAALAG